VCIDHSVDIDSLPATVGLNLFVLALPYPTVRTLGIMLWMSAISVINGGFFSIFREFCLNQPQGLLSPALIDGGVSA
jgi:hypothetical protein